MLLTPNVLTASVLACEFSDSWWLSVLIGVFTYFFLNLIPHWDPQNHKKLIVRAVRFVDFVSAFVFIIFIVLALWYRDLSFVFSSNSLELNTNVYSFIGAMANLVVYLVFYVFNDKSNRVWRFFVNIDHKLRYVDRSIWGISIQIAITILSLTIFFGLIDFPSWNELFDQILR